MHRIMCKVATMVVYSIYVIGIHCFVHICAHTHPHTRADTETKQNEKRKRTKKLIQNLKPTNFLVQFNVMDSFVSALLTLWHWDNEFNAALFISSMLQFKKESCKQWKFVFFGGNTRRRRKKWEYFKWETVFEHFDYFVYFSFFFFIKADKHKFFKLDS